MLKEGQTHNKTILNIILIELEADLLIVILHHALVGVKVLFRTALAILQLTFGSKEVRKQCTGYVLLYVVYLAVELFSIHSFYDITKMLRNLPISITHEDVLIPQV